MKGGYAAKECAFIYGTGLCIIAVVRPNVFDGLGSLERWVENGRPTRPILATKLRDDNVDQLAGLVTPDP